MEPASHAPMAPTPPSEAEESVPTAQMAHPTTPPRETYVPQLLLAGINLAIAIFAYLQMYNGSSSSAAGLFLGITNALLAFGSIYSFVVQWRAFARTRPMLFRIETVLLIASAIIPVAAAIIGDFHGSAVFGNQPELTLPGISFFALLCLVPALILVATGNALYIATRFHKAIKVLGAFGYALTWILLACVAYVAYSVQYSAHDPSSE